MTSKTGANAVMSAMDDDQFDEARKARQNAESQHRNVQRRWPLVRAIGYWSRKEIADNHFAERMRIAFDGPKPRPREGD